MHFGHQSLNFRDLHMVFFSSIPASITPFLVEKNRTVFEVQIDSCQVLGKLSSYQSMLQSLAISICAEPGTVLKLNVK